MSEAIIKTWPAFMPSRKTLEIFTHEWGQFYFTLGRGKPTREIEQLWFTHRGRILGHFQILTIVRNEGQLPKLTSLDGEESEWQIKPDAWVAICDPPFVRAPAKSYYSGFRGWRYFSWEKHQCSLDSKIPA